MTQQPGMFSQSDGYERFMGRWSRSLAPAFVRNGGNAYLWKGSRFESEIAEPGDWQTHWSHEGTRPVGDEQTVVARFLRL